MNRNEFILRLKQALSSMPEEERRRAVEYYENYFDEAGPENEAEVLRELGAPEKVAADILKNFHDVSQANKGKKRTSAREKFRDMDNGQKLLLVVFAAVAAVCIVPACAAVVGGVGGILIGILCAAAALFLCVPVLAITAWCCAVAFVIAAVVYAVKEAVLAVLFIGIALICAAIGILLGKLTGYLFRTVFPAMLNSIAGLFRSLFRRS